MDKNEINLKSPKKSPDFKRYWNLYAESIALRENFKTGHLKNLEILCDLLVDYDNLTNFVNENGFSYETSGRYGHQQKMHVEVSIRQKTIGQIKDFCKLLDITLAKDQSLNEDDDDEF